MPPVCILAGGLGSRLGSRVASVPKPLLDVAGQPFLLYPLRSLADHGVTRVVLCVGYLGELIESTIGTERFGMSIEYSFDQPGLDGTLGAIRRAVPLLGERFLVLYGDTYLQVDYSRVVSDWASSGQGGTMTVLRNRGRWGPSNTSVRGGLVVRHSKTSPDEKMIWIDYGLGGLVSSALDLVTDQVSDLSDLYSRMADQRQLRAFPVTRRFHEIGTEESLAETEKFLRSTLETK